jgi:hypothetical protein
MKKIFVTLLGLALFSGILLYFKFNNIGGWFAVIPSVLVGVNLVKLIGQIIAYRKVKV